MRDVLSEMGMRVAFSPTADFSGVSLEEKLSINNVIHKAFVQVNEEGTEAAAATAVTMGTESVSDYKPFTTDHPFLFLIVDKPSKSILFMGKVLNPVQ